MTNITPEQAQFTLKASGYKRISKGDGGESGTPEYRDKENALPTLTAGPFSDVVGVG